MHVIVAQCVKGPAYFTKRETGRNQYDLVCLNDGIALKNVPLAFDTVKLSIQILTDHAVALMGPLVSIASFEL